MARSQFLGAAGFASRSAVLEDPVNGTLQNSTCAARVGIETFQFAFVTKNGVAQAPANPLDSTLKTFTPTRGKTSP